MTKLKIVALIGVAGLGLIPAVRHVISDAVQIAALLQQRALRGRTPAARPPKEELGSIKPVYVALGSSFAAGPTVGDPVPNERGNRQGTLAYPFLLARKLGLKHDAYVNAASSGALLRDLETTQLDWLSPATKLVTLTAGGNDVKYSRDSMLAYFIAQLKSAGVRRWLERRLDPFAPVSQRPFEELARSFDRVLKAIRKRAPEAVVVIVTYVSILPPDEALQPLTKEQTRALWLVSEELHKTTIEAADRARATVVDMASISAHHNANSSSPWAIGYDNKETGAFIVHPNEAGHSACADQIYSTLADLNFLKEIQ